jgi:nitrate reductase NapAB chaperone NapD
MTSLPATRLTVRSFLVHVTPGCLAEVTARVATWPGCQVHPAENRDVLVVVVATSDRAEADGVDAALASTVGVEGVALVSGFTEELS